MCDFARGSDRVSMDGGAWLPLRMRYLPRWHHTGSYQLYTGEERVVAGASTPSCPAFSRYAVATIVARED